jgi:hypothetical protein
MRAKQMELDAKQTGKNEQGNAPVTRHRIIRYPQTATGQKLLCLPCEVKCDCPARTYNEPLFFRGKGVLFLVF